MVRRLQFSKGDAVKIITKPHQPLHEDDKADKIIEEEILDGYSFTDKTYYVIEHEYLPASNHFGENIFYYGTKYDQILISDVRKIKKTPKTRKYNGGNRRDKTKVLPCTHKTRTHRKKRIPM